MKKWFMVAVLGLSFSVAQANDVNEICEGVAEFAGEILDARKAGLSRNLSFEVVKESVADLQGEERQLVSALLNEVVDAVYDLDGSDIATKNNQEAKIFKSTFVQSFDEECRKELR